MIQEVIFKGGISGLKMEIAKISVDARRNFLTKDKSTAAAIITETETMLEKD
jgi:hypothetical protein